MSSLLRLTDRQYQESRSYPTRSNKVPWAVYLYDTFTDRSIGINGFYDYLRTLDGFMEASRVMVSNERHGVDIFLQLIASTPYFRPPKVVTRRRSCST